MKEKTFLIIELERQYLKKNVASLFLLFLNVNQIGYTGVWYKMWHVNMLIKFLWIDKIVYGIFFSSVFSI